MTRQDRRQVPGVIRASLTVFDLSVGQTFWSGRSVLLALLAGRALIGLGVAAAIAVTMRRDDGRPG